MNSRRVAIPVGVVVALAIAGLAAFAAVRAGSGSQAAKEELDRLTQRGRDNRVVATVNGQPILARHLETTLTFSPAGIADSSGRDLGGISADDALQREIDEFLLGQAAAASGIKVTEDEITQVIQAGILDPLKSPSLSNEQKDLIKSMLRAAGTGEGNALSDETLRATARVFLLTNRFVSASTKTREELLAVAHKTADIKIDQAVLASVKSSRAKK
jgi:hypothetical protein